jgi:hypothetical protein
MGDGYCWRIAWLLPENKQLISSKGNVYLFLTFELRIPTASAGVSIEMFCHKCALLATGASSLVCCYFTGLVDLVHSVSLGHYSALSFFFGS